MDWALRSLWLSHSLAMPTKQTGLSAIILGEPETFLNRRTVAVNRGSRWAQQACRRRGAAQQKQHSAAREVGLGMVENHTGRECGKNRQGDWKCQWITPSSSVNTGTLCVGMADAAPSGPASHQHLPVFLYSSPGASLLSASLPLPDF